MKERIKRIRTEAKLTQAEFGKKIGTEGNTITNYESGNRTPKQAILTAICKEFDICMEWLKDGTGPMHPIRDRKEEITYLFGKAMREGNEKRMALLSLGLNLTPEQVDLLAQMALQLAAEIQNSKKPES